MIQHDNCYIWWSAPGQGIFPQFLTLSVFLSRSSSVPPHLSPFAVRIKLRLNRKWIIQVPTQNSLITLHCTALATVLVSGNAVMCNAAVMDTSALELECLHF